MPVAEGETSECAQMNPSFHGGIMGILRALRPAIGFLVLPLMSVLRGTLLARQRSFEDYAVVDGSAAVQVGIVGAIILSLVFKWQLYATLHKLRRSSIAAWLIFCVFCAVSAVWSPAPLYTLFRSVEVLAVYLSICVAVNCVGNFQRAEQLVLGLAVTVILVSVIDQLRSVGFSLELHSNSAPMIAGMTVCYCWAEAGYATSMRKRYLLLCVIISGLALGIGTSASANVATCCGVLIVSILKGGKGRAVVVLAAIVVLVLFMTGAISVIEGVVQKVFFPGKNWETVQTGSGRLTIWTAAWPFIMEQPFLGYGFAAAPRATVGFLSAHNSLVDILLGTGIAGAFLFGLSGVLLLRELSRIDRRTWGYFGCCGVFVSVIVGSNATSFLGTQLYMPMYAFAAFASLYGCFVLPRGWQPGIAQRMLYQRGLEGIP